MIFRALKTFYSEELKSGYVKGLTYTVRDGNELLRGHVEKWLEEQRVEIVSEGPRPEAHVGGSGYVK